MRESIEISGEKRAAIRKDRAANHTDFGTAIIVRKGTAVDAVAFSSCFSMLRPCADKAVNLSKSLGLVVKGIALH